LQYAMNDIFLHWEPYKRPHPSSPIDRAGASEGYCALGPRPISGISADRRRLQILEWPRLVEACPQDQIQGWFCTYRDCEIQRALCDRIHPGKQRNALEWPFRTLETRKPAGDFSLAGLGSWARVTTCVGADYWRSRQ
jgi:hypothetical protein